MDQYSPKTSPRASRSPSVGLGSGGGDGGGNLKMSISLGQKPAIIQKGPFYLVRQEVLPSSEITGATNLMASKGLEHSYMKLTTKKMKDSLSSFLPHLPGVIDTSASEDGSSLRDLIEKPPVGGKELLPLSKGHLSGFRLHPGPLPEQYRMSLLVQRSNGGKKRKHKRSREYRRGGDENPGLEGAVGGLGVGGNGGGLGVAGSGAGGGQGDNEEREKRREKKHKKHDKDAEERRKRKKEKKRKRNKEEKD